MLKDWISGKAVEITPRDSVQQWKRGKCWAVICSNPIDYIHVSDLRGYATHGYCDAHYEAHKYRCLFLRCKERGKWFSIWRGRLREDKWPRAKVV